MDSPCACRTKATSTPSFLMQSHFPCLLILRHPHLWTWSLSLPNWDQASAGWSVPFDFASFAKRGQFSCFGEIVFMTSPRTSIWHSAIVPSANITPSNSQPLSYEQQHWNCSSRTKSGIHKRDVHKKTISPMFFCYCLENLQEFTLIDGCPLCGNLVVLNDLLVGFWHCVSLAGLLRQSNLSHVWIFLGNGVRIPDLNTLITMRIETRYPRAFSNNANLFPSFNLLVACRSPQSVW